MMGPNRLARGQDWIKDRSALDALDIMTAQR